MAFLHILNYLYAHIFTYIKIKEDLPLQTEWCLTILKEKKSLLKSESYFWATKDKTFILSALSQTSGTWLPVEFLYAHDVGFHSQIILSTAVSRLTYQ